MSWWAEVLVGAAIVIGLIGVVIPLLPGTALIALAIAVWALFGGGGAWWVLAVCIAVLGASWALKYAVGGARLSEAGVGRLSIVTGVGAGIVGFFLIPVIGLLIGFVAGVFAAEAATLRDARAGWSAALAATKAAGVTILIELAGGLIAATIWLVAVLAGV